MGNPLNINPTDIFEPRHIGPNEEETKQMLKEIGVASLDALIDQTVPPNIRIDSLMKLAKPMTEFEIINHIKIIAARNKVFRSFIGAGYSGKIDDHCLIIEKCFKSPLRDFRLIRCVRGVPSWIL